MTQTFDNSRRELEGATVIVQLCHGYGQPFLDLAREYGALFDRDGYRVITVYLTGPAEASVAAATGGDRVVFLGYTSRQIRGLKLGAILQLRRLCRQHGVRFAIAHRYKATYVASHVPGVFVVGVYHAFGDFRRRSRQRHVNARRDRIALLGVSDAVRDDLRASLPAWPPERIQTLYNRVDFHAMRRQLLAREEARDALGIARDAFVFANVGRLHPDKDQRTLIDAFAAVAEEMPDAQLLIVGEGRLRDALTAQIAALGLEGRVRLTGPVPAAARYFKAFDRFVLSSDHEPFGMVLLEAMVAGLPIAVSDCGGGPEVVGATGLAFPLGDSAALAQCLRQLYRLSAAECADWGRRMDERALRLFTPQAVADVFWALPFVRERLPG